MKSTDVTKSKECFSGFANVLMDSTGGRQVMLPPNSQALGSRVVEISMPAMSNFSGSLCCCDILRTSSLDAFSFRLAYLANLLITLACWLTASLDAAVVLKSSAWIAAPA